MLRCGSAPPGGPLSADLFGSWMAEVEDDLRLGRFDAVYLSLHGACQAEGDPAADLTILRRVRAIVGRTPVVASFDMHANLSEEVALLLDGATGSRVWPTGGGRDAAVRALGLLENIISGKHRPVGALARVPAIFGDGVLPHALGAIWNGPLAQTPTNVLDASVFGGFAWGDSPYAGPSALVWTDRDAGLARDTAATLALELSRWRSRPAKQMIYPDQAMSAIPHADPRPALLLDPSDDLASGGLADTPELLRAMMVAEATGLTGRVLLVALHDPDAVEAAEMVGPGHALQRVLGGRSTTIYGAGVSVRAVVTRIVDHHSAGKVAVLQSGIVDIVVSAEPLHGVDPALLEALGLRTKDYRVLALKGGDVLRAAFHDVVSVVIACDCPGPASPNLLRLPFHYVPSARRAAAQFNPEPATPPPLHRVESSAGSSLPPRGGVKRLASLGKASADEPNQRYEDRRSNAKQQWPEPLRAERS